MDDLDRLAHAIQLFLDHRANPSPRAAWLEANADYRDLLEPMLAEQDGSPPSGESGPSPVDEGAPGPTVRLRRDPWTGAVTSLGPYRVVETLGEGGMGTVYLAEQTEPIRRRVALKLIRRGMESREAISRFEMPETQAPALALTG